MERKYNAKGHDITNRGRRKNSVIVNRPDVVQAALAQLNREAKEELVLRNIKPQDRTTENGLKPGTFVRFNLNRKEIEDRYPDHSLNEIYSVRKVLYAFETSNSKEAVLVSNMEGEAMGYVEADCLDISDGLEIIPDQKDEIKKPKRKTSAIQS
jgi:hypothetical protein